MGDRVLIQVTSNKNEVSPALYLHWHGDSAPDLIRDLAVRMKNRDGDTSYAFARLVGLAHERIPGNLSMGVWNMSMKLTDTHSHGDAGCYIVNCSTWQVQAFGGYGKSFCAARNDYPNLTEPKLLAITTCMADHIREALHSAMSPCHPGQFLTAYIERDRTLLDVLHQYETGSADGDDESPETE
jgi:hypothetical protein